MGALRKEKASWLTRLDIQEPNEQMGFDSSMISNLPVFSTLSKIIFSSKGDKDLGSIISH